MAKFCDVKMLSKAGGSVNEDAVGAGENYLFVIDGATALTASSQANSAAWLARETAAALHRQLSDVSKTIPEIMRNIVRELCTKWEADPADGPSAGIAIFRLNGDKIEYFGLGDCSVSVKFKNGGFETREEENLARLDRIALDKMCALRAQTGCSAKEARSAINETLIEHRELKNTPRGYWCLDLTGEGIAHARLAFFAAEEVKSLFLCSDGFAQLCGFQAVESLPALHDLSEREGLETLFQKLYELQEQDVELLVLPRFKLRDDTSAVLANVK